MSDDDETVSQDTDPLKNLQWWRVAMLKKTREVHVHPLRDLVDHEYVEDCVCGPTPEAIKRSDGSVGWMYTHHSLDGREKRE